MNSEKPDVSEISFMELQEYPFPLRQEYRINISNRAYEIINDHSKENTLVEICGVLIGDIFKDAEGPYLEITDAIRGEYADNQAGEVKFTHETWSHINNIKDAEFSDKRIVGWYHSHPRFGVFLSSQDMFIHKNFFNQPWQVAFVVDPTTNDEGFFVWHSGNAVRIENFWLDGNKKEILRGVDDSQKRFMEDIDTKIENVSKHVKRGLRPFHYFIGLFIFIALLALNYVILNNSLNRLLNPLTQYLKGDSSSNTEEIQKKLSQNKLLSGLNIKIFRRGNQIWCLGEVYTWHQKELIARTIGSFENVQVLDLRGIIATHRYTVVPGESLGKISDKIYGNPDRWKDIFQANKEKINNPYRIQPFITLVLPE